MPSNTAQPPSATSRMPPTRHGERDRHCHGDGLRPGENGSAALSGAATGQDTPETSSPCSRSHARPAITFGVREFCEICRRYAQASPPKAISNGVPTSEIYNVSKRDLQLERRCREMLWLLGEAEPRLLDLHPRLPLQSRLRYNKDYANPTYRLGRWLAGTPLPKLILELDILSRYGCRRTARWWWDRISNSKMIHFAILPSVLGFGYSLVFTREYPVANDEYPLANRSTSLSYIPCWILDIFVVGYWIFTLDGERI